jgi:hypothetical protein
MGWEANHGIPNTGARAAGHVAGQIAIRRPEGVNRCFQRPNPANFCQQGSYGQPAPKGFRPSLVKRSLQAASSVT